MKNVLFVINNEAFGPQIKRWAILLKKHGEYEPIIFSTSENPGRDLEECRSNGISIVSWHSPQQEDRSGPIRAPKYPDTIIQKMKRGVGKIPGLYRCYQKIFSYSLRFYSNLVDLSRKTRSVEHLLDQYHICIMVIPESGPAYEAPVFISAAHKNGIPVITIPTEKYAARDYAEYYLTEPTLNCKGDVNNLFGILFPSWAISYKGNKLLRVQPELLLALELLRISPPHPWKMVGNREDVVAVDSRATYDFYQTEGVSPSQMQIIGTSEHDFMTDIRRDAETKRLELYESLGLPLNRPLIVSALIANHYLAGRPECDFGQYSDMVRFWVQTLGEVQDYNVVISLHPSQKIEDMKYIEQWGVRICQMDITALIPLGDIFVALSSTVPWAIACGKPVIIYDPYRYNFNDTMYKNAPGVLYVKEQDEFRSILQRLTTDPGYYKEVALKQAACAEQWGNLDGKAGERLVQLFSRVTK